MKPAAEQSARGGAEPFRDGDTVVFFGDSLTHGGRFHKYMADFYRTRYPGRRVRFVNSGIGGDTAGGALKRIPEDVAEYDPTWVVFHFGMNDVARWTYCDASSPALLRGRAAAYDNFCRNFDSLVTEVAKAAPRAKFIYLTPTIYDDTAIPAHIPEEAPDWAKVNQKGCSVALSIMAGHVLLMAERDGVPGIDLHSPMQNCLMKRRPADPRFMLTRFDRVHPEAPGHAIMAWTFLKAQGVDPVVSDVAVDASASRVAKCVNAEVSDVVAAGGGVAFTVLAKSLPFPVAEEAAGLVDEFDVAGELNREIVAVANLAPGHYAMAVDGRPVGEWTSKELAAGVNLAFNAKTPQYAQAREVFDANERNACVEKTLRDHHRARWAYSGKVDVDDVAAFAKWAKETGESGPFAKFIPGYVGYWPHYRETRAALLREQEKVYALAVTKPRRYEITPLPPHPAADANAMNLDRYSEYGDKTGRCFIGIR